MIQLLRRALGGPSTPGALATADLPPALLRDLGPDLVQAVRHRDGSASRRSADTAVTRPVAFA